MPDMFSRKRHARLHSWRAPVFLVVIAMDTIANMLTGIINAQRVGKPRVAVGYSRLKEALARLLQAKGFIAAVWVKGGPQRQLIITLVYLEPSRQPRIAGLVRLSTPGRRKYVRRDQVPYPLTDRGAIVLSTSQGLMDDRQARAAGVGGELVCEVYV